MNQPKLSLEFLRDVHCEFFKRLWPQSIPFKTEENGKILLLLRDGKLGVISYKYNYSQSAIIVTDESRFLDAYGLPNVHPYDTTFNSTEIRMICGTSHVFNKIFDELMRENVKEIIKDFGYGSDELL